MYVGVGLNNIYLYTKQIRVVPFLLYPYYRLMRPYEHVSTYLRRILRNSAFFFVMDLYFRLFTSLDLSLQITYCFY